VKCRLMPCLIVLLAFGSVQGMAADLLPEDRKPDTKFKLDWSAGAALATDYNFRGISQSDRSPSVNAYIEASHDWLYAGAAAYTIDLPTNPFAEIDIYAGIRPVLGALHFDAGAIYYIYPNETQFITPGPVIWTPKNTDYGEIYGKVTYNFQEKAELSGNVAFAPNWGASGAGAFYASLALLINLPENFSISGEFGNYQLGKVDAIFGGADLPDYTYWNLGATYTYNKTVKFDLRYHDTSLSPADCFALTSDPGGVFSASGTSNWCGSALIGTLSFSTPSD
jgi:uncharacterized protein (TIGR02001 family)